jgi:hypothetical protein
MKATRLGVFVVVVVSALTLSIRYARASGDPFAGYCIVQKVVAGQDEAERSTIQIWGTCSMITPGGLDERGNYVFSSVTPPQRGYLYYFTTKANESVSQKEWADLKALAGTGEVVGIGRQGMPGRMRWADEKPQSPFEYPTQMGLWKITTNPAYAKLVAELKKAADGK